MLRILGSLRHFVLRMFFQLLYHEFAFGYDLVSYMVSLGLWKSWIFSTEDYLEGPSILEIGHGPGHLLCSLSKRGFWAAGIDESWQMIHQAKHNFEKANLKIKSVNGSAHSLPYKNNIFNQVVATFPSNFIFNRQALDEIYRVLVPGGLFIVVPTAWITGKIWFHKLAAWLFRITQQSPLLTDQFEVFWTSKLNDSGYQVTFKYIHLETSLVLLIIAKKHFQQTLEL